MSASNWTIGLSGDWNTAADWSGGVPSVNSTATIAGAGSFLLTLLGTGAVGNLTMSAAGAVFSDQGTLSLAGKLSLQAGTLALNGGTIAGGTLSLLGGQFASARGTLSGVTVQGVLSLSTPQSFLVVQNGLKLTGAGGSGAGSLSITGGYATLDFLGSQTLDNATISIGALSSQPGGAGPATLALAQGGGVTQAATLTLGSHLWLRGVAGQGEIAVGSIGPVSGSAPSNVVVNQGTITAGAQGETLTIAGNGTFANQGTISVSNGTTLQIATSGFSNTGTILVSNATLSLGGTYATSLLSGLGAISLSAGQLQLAGLAVNTGTLSLGTGSAIGATLGALSLAGTLMGGTVADGGGGLSFAAGTGVLDNVIYAGVLNLSGNAVVTLQDCAGVTSATGGLGSILDTGAGSALLLSGSETLDNVQIALGSAGTGARIATADPWLASTATTATLGAHCSIVQSGANASLQALGWSSVAGFGAADTLINQGTLTASLTSGLLTLGGYGTIVNQGTIVVSGGDTLQVGVQDFVNTGTLVIAAGGTALLGQSANWLGIAPVWSNAGQINVTGGTLVLGGAFSTAQLGGVAESSGLIQLAGTLSNTGATLSLGGAGLSGLSLAGTIAGGTIVDPNGALTLAPGALGGQALLDGVAYQGTMTLGAGSTLRVRDGLALAGAFDILGAGSVLDFQGSQTIGRGQILLGAAGQGSAIDIAHDASIFGASTLTLGAGLSIAQSGQFATIGRTSGGTGLAGDMIVSQGTITANVAGGTLTLGGQGFTNAGVIAVGAGETLAISAANFLNSGAIDLNGGVLSIGGSLSLSQLGQVNLSGGAIAVAGTLDLGGGTLAIGQGSSDGRVSLTGTIANGTIIDTGFGLGAIGNATLAGVTYNGTLDLSRPFSQLAIAGGLTLAGQNGSGAGQIVLTGAESRLLVNGSQTLNNVSVLLGGGQQSYLGQRLPLPELAAEAGTALMLGGACTLTLNGAGGILGDAGLGQWSDSVINQGTIIAGTLAGTLSLGASNFINAGIIVASAGGVVSIGDVSFINTGTLSAAAGSALLVTLFDYYAAPNAGPSVFINSGTIALRGGNLQEQTAAGLFPAVPLANLAGGIIAGNGGVFAPIANSGTIDAQTGVLTLNGALTGSGSLEVDGTATLEVASAVPTSQTVHFTSAAGTLKLDSPGTFAGVLSGFGAGDMIDLPSAFLTGVGLSSGTLVLSTATLNYRLLSTTPFAGELSAGHDAHGGATVMLTPQSLGTGGSSGLAIIAVSQPKMLFWASPVGDVFKGPGVDVNGAHISNWSAADSIDITDLAAGRNTISLTQGIGVSTLTVTGGAQQVGITIAGTYAASSFHLTADGHGGTILSYGH